MTSHPATRCLPAAWLLLSLLCAPAVATQTLRVDYFHTGGLGEEIFSLDRVSVEPLPWPGSPAGNLDPIGAGKYRYRVETREGTVLFSRGFASIYGEWETTEEAASAHRTFHESLRLPMPEKVVDVVLSKRQADNSFVDLWRTSIDPADSLVDTALPPRRELLEIEVHGPPQDKLDLLLLGDGYTQEQCAEKFPRDARHLTDVLFRYQPFARHRQDLNIWGICPPASESGISRPSTGIHRRSPIGSTYDAFGSERYVLTFDNRALRDTAAWAPYELVEILANSETYGGGGIFNLFATVAVDNDWADYVFIHEFGHHMAGLADEYYTSPVAYQAPTTVVEPWEPNVTALLDPAHLKWGSLVSEATPIPTPWPKQAFEEHAREIQKRRVAIREQLLPESEMSALFREERDFETKLLQQAPEAQKVGAFRGANYDAQAFYRPQIDCVMFTRDDVPFCAVCQQALERVIEWHTGKLTTKP